MLTMTKRNAISMPHEAQLNGAHNDNATSVGMAVDARIFFKRVTRIEKGTNTRRAERLCNIQVLQLASRTRSPNLQRRSNRGRTRARPQH